MAKPGERKLQILARVQGRWQQFVKSGFQSLPLAQWDSQWAILVRGIQATSPLAREEAP